MSVNDIQLVGPTIQDPLFNILIRFRQHRYIISGDIENMYRQVTLRESDRNLQLILWRDEEKQDLRTLQLNTYGFSSASFLSTRCLWQLGEECSDPKIKTIIQKDFYCDDLLTGCDSTTELCYIQRQVSSHLAKGCFPLRKYRSNWLDLFAPNSINIEEGYLIISNSTSTLGIGWSPSSDHIFFRIDCPPITVSTKRSILSTTSKIFDPLGLLSLCTIKPKRLLQKLWFLKLDWDEPVPLDIQKTWQNFSLNVSSISSIQLPRHALIENHTYIEMHCFCDASKDAYGACIYLKSVDAEGSVKVSLLCAKSRVAPLKASTIPRLELCAAVVGAQLTSSVTQALRCTINRHIFWTDSSVVLGWLKTPNKTKTFVANREAAIGELTDYASWRHVPTTENPADLLSRGIDPQNVADCAIWWHGPTFLLQHESSWPSLPLPVIQLPELKVMPALVAEVESPTPAVDFDRFSTRHSSKSLCQSL